MAKSSRGGLVRTFVLSPSSVERISFDTFKRILELDTPFASSGWQQEALALRQPKRSSRTSGLNLTQSLFPRRKALCSLYIEHKTRTSPLQTRPYSQWSRLLPWDAKDGSLQTHLLQSFFRSQLAEDGWIVLSVREPGEGPPDQTESWGPSGLRRVGKGLSRLSWGLGNLFAAVDAQPNETVHDREHPYTLLDDDGDTGPSIPSHAAPSGGQIVPHSDLDGSGAASRGFFTRLFSRKRLSQDTSPVQNSAAPRKNSRPWTKAATTGFRAKKGERDAPELSQSVIESLAAGRPNFAKRKEAKVRKEATAPQSQPSSVVAQPFSAATTQTPENLPRAREALRKKANFVSKVSSHPDRMHQVHSS